METDLLAALQSSAPAQYFRLSRWGYAVLNASHILGVGLIVGAIAPLDLRLMGCWRSVDLAIALRLSRPVAAAGVVLALGAGMMLFSVRAVEYAGLTVFWVKMGLLAAGVANALAHGGARLLQASPGRRFAVGAASLTLWCATLLCGRLIAFM